MTNRNVQLGILPTNGPIITGAILQTARVDLPGPYDAVNGTVVGDSIRFGPYRLYDGFGSVMDGSAFAANSIETMVHNAGHTVLLSYGAGGFANSAYKQAHPDASWWAGMAAGYADNELRNLFARIHGLQFGPSAVTPVNTTTGSRLPIPGSTKRGTKPTEVVLCPVSHEPNIPETHFGTAAEFAAANRHFMTVYDNWRAAQSPAITVRRIKVAVIISNPGGNVASVCGSYYGIGTANDISGASARPVDYPGWDIYYPKVEKGNGPATPGPASGGNGDSVYFGSKFAQLNSWTYSTGTNGGHFSNTTRQVIGEIGCRIQTARSGDGTAPDAGWANKFWNDATSGFTKWNQNNALPNGDHPLIYVCLFASGSLMKQDANHGNGATGNIDNSIIPDTTTYDATFQNGGYSVRPQFVAVRTCLVANGNETLQGLQDGITPGALTLPAAPGAGVTSTQLTLPALVAPNVAQNLYQDGVRIGPELTTGSVTVSADPNRTLPQDRIYKLKGVGTSGVESASFGASVTVHYLVGSITHPGTPSQPVVTNVGQTTAVFTVPAVPTTTRYSWMLDGNTDLTAPDFTSPTPTISASGLLAGAHTVKCVASNAGGPSGFSAASASFTMSSNPDTHAPPTPGTPTVTDMGAQGNTPTITWTAVTDTVTAGETTSGLREYPILRSLSNLPETAVEIDRVPASQTSYTDNNAPQSTDSPTDVYYFVAARDNVLLTSDPSTPVVATVPASTTASGPIAVLSLPTQVNVGALFTADATNSTPGTGGAINGYRFDFEDGTADDPADLTNPLRRHTYDTAKQYLVTLRVTDASGNVSPPVQQYIIAAPSDGLTFPETGAPRVLSGSEMTAASVDTPMGVFDAAIGHLNDQADQYGRVLAQIGDPVTPRRHGGAVFASINPETATTAFNLQPATLYVIRCTTIDGGPFSTVNWAQSQTGVGTVTGAFFAVYDVDGNLISPTGALTDVSAKWMASGEQSFTLDGAPFDPPLGDDNSDNLTQITDEFFLAFYLATVGSTHPQIASGSLFSAVNMGTSLSAVTPSQVNIQTVPLFSTSAATVGTALNAPASLGSLTRWNASACVVLYP